MKRLKKIIKLLLLIAFLGIVYSFFFSAYENIKINKIVRDFKSRSIFETEELVKVNNFEYYKRYNYVPRETSKELDDKNNVFYDLEKKQLGIDGDIFATRQSPFPEIKPMHWFMSYYFGGHAALLAYDEMGLPTYIEAAGFPTDDESIFDYIFHDGLSDHDLQGTTYRNKFNYWQKPMAGSNHYYFDSFYRSKYFGLRPTNPFEGDDRDLLYNNYVEEAVNTGIKLAEDEMLYNFLFFLNMKNKYYCSDLMSRVYEDAFEKVANGKEDYRSKGYGKKMNDDNFITSIQDLILSKDTLLTFYVEIKEEKRNGNKVIVKNIYYLEDVQ